jgi:hypothetical protein
MAHTCCNSSNSNVEDDSSYNSRNDSDENSSNNDGYGMTMAAMAIATTSMIATPVAMTLSFMTLQQQSQHR